MSRRVLMVAYSYYPSNSSGAHRPAKFAKYLPEFGWTSVVLCPRWTPENLPNTYDASLAAQPDVCRVVRVEHPPWPRWRPLRVAWWLGKWLLPYRTPLAGLRRMLAAGRDLVRNERFDAVWSTFKPGLNHTVASRLAREADLPWVADFRDLPDQSEDTWRSRLTVRSEIRCCRNASALVTTSPMSSEQLARRHAAPVHTVFNGFDPEAYPPRPESRSETFDIVYTGILYAFRNPGVVFEALDRLARGGFIEAEDIRLRFYGADESMVRSLAQGTCLETRTEAFGRVPHSEMVRIQQQAVILLNLKSPAGGGSIPAKLFDYLGAQRPILNVPGDDGPVDHIIRDTGAGVTAGTPDAVADTLLDWYRAWKSAGTVAWRGRPEAIATYSRRHQTGKLAAVLDELVAG